MTLVKPTVGDTNWGPPLNDALDYLDDKPFYSVRDFGIAPHDSNDQTAAINTMIDTVSGRGGGVIVFPKGATTASTYIGDIILKSGVHLTGFAPHYGYHQTAPSMSPVRLRPYTNTGYAIDTPSGGATACSVSGLTLVGNSAQTGGGIRFKSGSNWSAVKNVHINGFGDEGVKLDAGTVAITLEHVFPINCLLDRSRSATAGVVDIDGGDHVVIGVEASASTTALSDSNMYLAAFYVKGANHFFNTCVGEISDRGWVITAGTSSYVGCRGDLNFAHDWHLVSGGSSQYAACRAVDGGRAAANTYDGFFIESQGNQFAACRATQLLANTYKYGFEDTVVVGSVLGRNQYAACMATGWATADIVTGGWQGSAPVRGNAAIYPAKSATIDVTAAGLVALDNFDTATTITTINGGTQGQELSFIGNPNVTIDHNGSNIFTNTGADITLVSGRAYKFIKHDNKWYQFAP